MGAALLLEWASPQTLGGEDFARVAAEFPDQIQAMAYKELEGQLFRLRVWAHPQARTNGVVEDHSTGSWLVLIGNPARPDLSALGGKEILRHLLDDCLRKSATSLTSLSPPFAAVFYDGRTGIAHVQVDRLGFQHLYVRAEPGSPVWISSSGLALAAALPSTVDLHHVAEWLAMGHFMSDRTFVRETRKLGCGERLRLDGDGARSEALWEPTPSDLEGGPRESTIEPFLNEFFKSLDAAASGPGLATEMTGGIDSRFLLASILARRIPALAWTLGQPGWRELSVIERLQKQVPFPHKLVTVDERLIPRLPSLIDEMQKLSDGEANALEYAPLLMAFEQLEGHRVTSLSGVAGEIARGFYYGLLRSRSRQLRDIPIEALLAKETRPAASARDCFAQELSIDPIGELRMVVEDFVRKSHFETPEGILEDLYLRARLQRFAGRNFTTTGYFCRQGLPYFGNDFVDFVLRLPFETKLDGWIIRKSLMRISPKFSSVPLIAGMVVPPASWLRPDRALRRYSSLGRRAASKYGGNLGRRMAATGPEMVPWNAARSNPDFREFVQELLLAPQAKTASFLERDRVTGVIDGSFAGRNLYPLGLLITLELTLRRIAGRGQTAS